MLLKTRLSEPGFALGTLERDGSLGLMSGEEAGVSHPRAALSGVHALEAQLLSIDERGTDPYPSDARVPPQLLRARSGRDPARGPS